MAKECVCCPKYLRLVSRDVNSTEAVEAEQMSFFCNCLHSYTGSQQAKRDA